MLSLSISASTLYERQMNPDMIKSQREYSSEKIFELIRGIKKDNEKCNVNIESDGYYFAVIKEDHSFSFVNNVLSGKRRHRSRYECLLNSEKTKLECEQRLPRESNSILQQSDNYVRLTINLNEQGLATSMYGVKSRKYSIAGYTLPNLLEKTITEFKCDIETLPLVKDERVSDKKRKEIKKKNSIKEDESKIQQTVDK